MPSSTLKLVRPDESPWLRPDRYWPSLDEATAGLDPPFGVLSLPALSHNAFSMLDRASGKPIRVASKSVRVRGVLDAVLALPGYAGVLAYTLPEALWLATKKGAHPGIADVVVGYPTADRTAIGELARSAVLASRVTLMVDSVEQLDFIDSVVAPNKREAIRVCVELDASFRSFFLGTIGVFRSPAHTVEQIRDLAAAIVARPGFSLVGLMGYEAQIAGVGDVIPNRKMYQRTIRQLQKMSTRELAGRRASAVRVVRELAELEFVNGGGTGSIERTVAEDAVTEVAAGSGLFGPHLFDHYRHFHPAPASSFALAIVRRPDEKTATLLGGGWIASGPIGPDRLPQIAWPRGLTMVEREMAGEVQSPVRGSAAEKMRVGDRVWFRHTKAGELSEHLNEFLLVDKNEVVGVTPTYRGEGKAFL